MKQPNTEKNAHLRAKLFQDVNELSCAYAEALAAEEATEHAARSARTAASTAKEKLAFAKRLLDCALRTLEGDRRVMDEKELREVLAREPKPAPQ